MKKFLVFILLAFFLIACQGEVKTYSYKDVNDKHLTYENIFSPPNFHYFIYVYSGGCYVCDSIKQEIIPYGLSHDNFYFLIYSHELTPPNENFIQDSILGVSDVTNIYLIGTPTMLEIKEAKIDSYYLGSEKILTKLGLF